MDKLFNITFCRFSLDNQIGVGGAGSIFKETTNSGLPCVVKKQLRKDDTSLMKEEDVYLALNNSTPLFPRRLYFGEYGRDRILVLTRHGTDLYDLTLRQKGLSFEKVAMTIFQITYRLKKLHELGFIHRDIKPENIMVGRYNKDSRLEHDGELYLIDFGSSSKFEYWDYTHYEPGAIRTHQGGTELYGSVRFHQKMEQSRRDDLISLCYTAVFLYTQSLPWAHFIDESTKMYEVKRQINADTLFKGFPKEFKDAYLYINSLEFHEQPAYDTIMSFMRRYLTKRKVNFDRFSYLK